MDVIHKSLTVILWKARPGSTERKVLLLRLIPERGGFWQSPTGSVEHGEGFTEAALREAEEETGLHFDRVPQFLGLEYEFQGRWGYVKERAFFLPLQGGSEPPTPKLDPKEHDAYQWVSPEEAAKLVKFAGNKEAIERAAQEVPPLLLNKRGVFFQDGEEITHSRTVELLHKSLQKNANGSYLVRIGSEELDVMVEDCPRFVTNFDAQTGQVRYLHGDVAVLNPDALEFRADNSCICTGADGWKAVLLPSAYYELTKHFQEGSVQGEYVFHFLGRVYRFRVSH